MGDDLENEPLVVVSPRSASPQSSADSEDERGMSWNSLMWWGVVVISAVALYSTFSRYTDAMGHDYVPSDPPKVPPPDPSKSVPSHTEATEPPLRILYITGYAIPMFPLTGYGGMEADIEAEVEGLAALDPACVDFRVVVPKRPPNAPRVPFDGKFIQIPAGHSWGQWLKPLASQWQQTLGGFRPDIIWCHAEGCPDALHDKGIPIITTMHWGSTAKLVKNYGNVRYRVPTLGLYLRWLQNAAPPDRQWLKTRMVPVHLAFPDEEFQYSGATGDYILWVASCGWAKTKGLDRMLTLAERHKDLKFRVYCSGQFTETAIKQKMDSLSNVEFKGALKRGKDHHEAFRNARGFFMYTTMAGETFGRTVVESLSKGTPVFGNRGSWTNPELVQSGAGFLSDNLDELGAHLKDKFDRRVVYASSLRFHTTRIVNKLLELSRDLLAESGKSSADFAAFSQGQCTLPKRKDHSTTLLADIAQ